MHIKFRRRGITQKKAYNIQNKARVWNQVYKNNSIGVPFVLGLALVYSQLTTVQGKKILY